MRIFFLLLLIVFFGFVLRIAEINDVLIHDEAYTYIAFASKNLIHAVTDYSLPNNHIFHTVLVYLSTQIFGPHVWSVRLPALLAGMAIIVSAYYLGKIFYSPQAGIATAALVAFFPRLVHYSTIARGYSLMGLLTILSVIFGYCALQTKKKIFWGLLSLSMALGFWTIPIMLFPAGAIYLWLLLEGLLIHRKEYRALLNFGLHLFASGLLTVFLTALLYYPVIHVSGLRSLVGNTFVLPMEKALWWEKFLHQVSRAWQVWAESIPDPLLYLLIFGFALSLVFHPQISKIRILTQVVFFGWILFLAWYQRAGAFERFWTFLLPFLFLWAVAPWTELSKKIKWKNFPFSWAISSLAVIFLLFTSATVLPGIPARWRASSNAEQVGIYLAERMQTGEIALIGNVNAPPIWFYMQENGLDSSYWRIQSDFSALYVVISVNHDGETVESVLKASRLEYISPDELVYQYRYGGILIYHYAP